MEGPTRKVNLLCRHEVLVLSTGYEPLFKTCWKRAISAVSSGRAEIIERHDSLWIGTATGKIMCPTVVRFVTGVIAAKLRVDYTTRRPTKKLLHSRDLGRCQYCFKKIGVSNATIDHVIPKSRGGCYSWENLVIACAKCNGSKGSSLLSECKMKLLKKPTRPRGIFLPILA